MPTDSLIAAHRSVQNAAKSILDGLGSSISALDTEKSIADRSYQQLVSLGFEETWYYKCPAFVLAGSRSCLSISGRDYVPNREPIGEFNMITVDLSPMRSGHWGDCARSFYIENGRARSQPIAHEFISGKEFVADLHREMMTFVHPNMEFQELFHWTNDRIRKEGFENLDFLGNVGHSIATQREDRQFIEATNHRLLGSVPFFTFEPHVREVSGRWGFKHENIFFFNSEGGLVEL